MRIIHPQIGQGSAMSCEGKAYAFCRYLIFSLAIRWKQDRLGGEWASARQLFLVLAGGVA